ncbi:acetylcholinesterase-like isoform X1 [Amblyomma americanum]
MAKITGAPLLWAAVLVFVAACYAKRTEEIISTTSGPVQGAVLPSTAGPVRTYLGIPFAEPPVGEQRFKKPRPKKPWKDVLNATLMPPLCPQFHIHFNSFLQVKPSDAMSEDCLFLNVFAPAKADSIPKAVIAYFHGGAFSYAGIGMKMFDASELAARGGVVVVTVAYRLGALGFLNLGTEDAPGNMGLYDQLLAMRWVKANARAFGGDPNAITLMGQSAGAISIGFHLISPLSKRLFRRAIMQSASPFTSSAVSKKDQSVHRAKLLMSHLNCDRDGTRELSLKDAVLCLRSKSSKAILDATSQFTTFGLDGFFPVIGQEFVPEEPASALRHVKLNAEELLTGAYEAEGDAFIRFILKTLLNTDDIGDLRKSQMVILMKTLGASLLRSDPDPIVEKYFSHIAASDGKGAVYAASDLAGHNQFSCPTFYFARGFVRPNTTVYVYEASQGPSSTGLPKWVRPTHADDIVLSLGSILSLAANVSEADESATKMFINMVSTFSRSGVPKVSENTPWPKFNDGEQYMHLSGGGIVVKKRPLQSICNFWNKVEPYD